MTTDLWLMLCALRGLPGTTPLGGVEVAGRPLEPAGGHAHPQAQSRLCPLGKAAEMSRLERSTIVGVSAIDSHRLMAQLRQF